MPFGSTPLNDGNKIPQIAFGTGSKWKGSDVTDYVEQALENGFSHIDTAAIYKNEETVGLGIRQSALKREELYLTGKYDGGYVREEIEKSLKKLGVTYFDLYLIHHPMLVPDGDFTATWEAFEKIKADGLAKSIGVSNFAIKDLQKLLKSAKVVPAVNQISFNPYNYAQNIPLLEFCAKYKIVIEGYSPLAPITKMPGGPVDNPVQRAAKRIGATPAQVLLLWVYSKGVVIVTTSSKSSRLREYLNVADFPSLTAEEIAKIEHAGAMGFSFSLQRVLARRIVTVAALVLMGFGVCRVAAGAYI